MRFLSFCIIVGIVAAAVHYLPRSDDAATAQTDKSGGSQDDLKYDPQEAIRAAQLNNLVAQTRLCLREGTRDQLQWGNRNSTAIVAWTSRTCGVPLVVYMAQELHQPTSEGSALVEGMANEELSNVPGLSRQ